MNEVNEEKEAPSAVESVFYWWGEQNKFVSRTSSIQIVDFSCRFYEMIPKITKSQIVQDFILNVKDAPLEFSHTSESINEKLCRFSVY